MVMRSKCTENLRQRNIKREWCWRRTKAVGRWRRFQLFNASFPSRSFFGVLSDTASKTSPRRCLNKCSHVLSCSCCVYRCCLKWLPSLRPSQGEHHLSDRTVADGGNMRPANERRAAWNGTLCPLSLCSDVCDWSLQQLMVSQFCWHLIRPPDRVIIGFTAGAHLWGDSRSQRSTRRSQSK